MVRESFLPSKFEILEKINSGYFGTVWKVNNSQVDRIEAVKEIQVDNPQEIDDAFDEAKHLVKLSECDNIVKIYDADLLDENKGIYIQMEYLEKGSIGDISFISTRRFKNIFLDVLRALGYAHSHGIVHRDIKPGNILLANNGTPKLSDFGLAIRAAIGIGTSPAGYMYIPHTAPELLSGGPATTLTDVYALGVTMYRVINGDPPEWEKTSTDELRTAVLRGEFPRRGYYRLDIPLPLTNLIDKALEIDPTDRFQSTHEMREELEKIPVKCEWVKKEGTKETVEWNGSTGNKNIQVIYYLQDRKIITKSGKIAGKLRNITKLCYSNLSRSDGNYRISLILRGFTSGKYT